MNKVAVVGLGKVGVRLAHRLHNLGWTVKGSNSHSDKVNQLCLQGLDSYFLQFTPDIQATPNDLEQLFAVNALVITLPPTQLLSPIQYEQAVKNAVQMGLDCGVTQIIFTSSTTVLPNRTGQFTEDCVPEANNPTDQALINIENYLLNLNHINVDIIRFGGIVTPYSHPVQTLATRPLLHNGNTPINLVHIDDCVQALQSLLETPSGKRCYHLVAPQHPSRAQYYVAMADKWQVNTPQFICSSDDLQRQINGDKICRELNFNYLYPNPFDMLPQSNSRDIKSLNFSQ